MPLKISKPMRNAILDVATGIIGEASIRTEIRMQLLREKLEGMRSRVLHETALLVVPQPCIERVEPKPLLHVPPRLMIDEVTKYFIWEETTWRQRIIEETEREVLGPKWVAGWDVGWERVDTAPFATAVTSLVTTFASLAAALQLPPAYLGLEAAKTVTPLRDKKDDG